uniref:Dynein assembly factor 5, axonemal n=1 Tax=Cacopsylla melanoneura TaxID=428564 RepID=A0A8D8SUP7_9HEMI
MEDQELFQSKFENNINILSSNDKKRKLQVLSDIRTEIQTHHGKGFVKSLVQSQYPMILACVNDKAEACRELAITIVGDIVDYFVEFLPEPEHGKSLGTTDELIQTVGNNASRTPKEEVKTAQVSLREEDVLFSREFTNQVVQLVRQKLVGDNSVESSEEVRLHLLHLLHRLILKLPASQLSPIFLHTVTILSATLPDPYPDIKLESAHLVSSIASRSPRDFFSSGECLIVPLVANVSHRHSKVRIASVRALGDAVQYGNNKALNDVTGPLAERLFDHHAAVRTEILEVSTRWCLQLSDRYSYFVKIIPLVLTCLCDELPSIQVKAYENWQRIGDQYYQENKSDTRLKDKMDFLSQELKHYPEGVPRPNLGCRVLVQREMSKFLPALKNELHHWLPQVRIKSAQLLCSLSQHEEHNIVQHIPSLLSIMYQACNDEESSVRDNVERAAEMIGYFVPPNVYCPLILPVLNESCTVGHITVLAAILKGGSLEDLTPEVESIARFLAQPHICQSREATYQSCLLSIVQKLLTTLTDPSFTHSSLITQYLFNVLIAVLALATRKREKDQCVQLLGILTERSGFESQTELFKELSIQVLSECEKEARDWCVASPGRCMFLTLLTYSNIDVSLLAHHSDTVVGILSQVVQPDNDATLILKMLLLLCECLENSHQFKGLDPVLHRIIREVLSVHLVWRAGKSQEALRTAAVVALRSCLSSMSSCATNMEDSMSCDSATVAAKSIPTAAGDGNSRRVGTVAEQSDSCATIKEENHSYATNEVFKDCATIEVVKDCAIENKTHLNGCATTVVNTTVKNSSGAVAVKDDDSSATTTDNTTVEESSSAMSTENTTAEESCSAMSTIKNNSGAVAVKDDNSVATTTDNTTVEESCSAMSTTVSTVLPMVLGCLEDGINKTRLYSVDCLYLLLSRHQLKLYLSSDMFDKLYQEVLKRLDDENDEVRLKSLELISFLFEHGVPDCYHVSDPILSLVFRTLLIHLDDQDTIFQQHVLGMF